MFVLNLIALLGVAYANYSVLTDDLQQPVVASALAYCLVMLFFKVIHNE